MDMIERVARAMVEAADSADTLQVRMLPSPEQSEIMARAAIEAMREPTSDMINSVSFWPGPWTRQGFLDNWKAALDAALSGPQAKEGDG